jgi:hypothetical protein
MWALLISGHKSRQQVNAGAQPHCSRQNQDFRSTIYNLLLLGVVEISLLLIFGYNLWSSAFNFLESILLFAKFLSHFLRT